MKRFTLLEWILFIILVGGIIAIGTEIAHSQPAPQDTFNSIAITFIDIDDLQRQYEAIRAVCDTIPGEALITWGYE